jgi:hypothetical protein
MSEGVESSYLYLLSHLELKVHKVGIGTRGRDKGRLQDWIDQGWVSHGIWSHGDRQKSFQWEREVFSKLGIRFAQASKDAPGFLGRSDKHWFEGISADAISVEELSDLISKVVGKKP